MNTIFYYFLLVETSFTLWKTSIFKKQLKGLGKVMTILPSKIKKLSKFVGNYKLVQIVHYKIKQGVHI